MLPYQFPSCPYPGPALSTAGSERGAQGAPLIPHTAGTEPWLPGHGHLLAHQAEQRGQGPSPAAHKLQKEKNPQQKRWVFCSTDKGTLL